MEPQKLAQHSCVEVLTTTKAVSSGIWNVFLGLLFVVLTYFLFPSTGSAHTKIGGNLNSIADFNRNHEFVDLVKQSRLFLTLAPSAFDDSEVINRAPVGADGWPTTDFRLFVMAGNDGVLGLGGVYKISFTGAVSASLGGFPNALSNRTFDAATNTTRIDWTWPNGNDNIFLEFRNTGGTLKNLKIIRPGFPAVNTPTFTPQYLDHIKRFSLLRFMDWSRTNENNEPLTLADRLALENRRVETKVARWETIIELANAVQRDIWINIPVHADDAYVTSVAQLMKATLKPQLNIYIEYSNEIWNGQFAQSGVNRSLTAAELAANPASPLRFDNTTDQFVPSFRRVGKRSKEISDLFKGVFGQAAINTRVRVVLAGQMANPFILNEGLRVVQEGMGVPVGNVFYAISGAPYYFLGKDDVVDASNGASVTQILDGLEQEVDAAPVRYFYAEHAAIAARFGLKVMAYEGGPDTFGGNNLTNKRLAYADPRMRTICNKALNDWYKAGLGEFLWFSLGAGNYNTQFGQWPVLEDMNVPNTPRNLCLTDQADGVLPAITAGFAAPTVTPVASGGFVGSSTPSVPLSNATGPLGFPGFVEYLIRSSKAGRFNISFRAQGSSDAKVQVSVNGLALSGTTALPTVLGNAAAGTHTLREGLNVLRLTRPPSAGSWTIQTISVDALADAAPTVFSFAAQSGVAVTTVLTSSTVTLAGLAAPVAISIENGFYSIGCNGLFTGVSGTIVNGQSVCVQHLSSAIVGAVTTTILRVGSVSANFVSTTAGVVLPPPVVAADAINFFRLYNPVVRAHLYTRDENEYNVLRTRGWSGENAIGRVFVAAADASTIPLLRLFSPTSSVHLFTTDENEDRVLGTRGWIREGPAAHILKVGTAATLPVTRLYLLGTQRHILTTDENEVRVLVGIGAASSDGIIGHIIK